MGRKAKDWGPFASEFGRGDGGPDDDDDGGRGGRASSAPKERNNSSNTKTYKPGMSGKDQKARAKELRLENERRKFEREKRNHDKRERREREEEELAATATATATPERAIPRSRDPEIPSKHRHHQTHRPRDSPGASSAGDPRRELKRLFGRIEHGGGVSPSTGAALGIDDVVVVTLDHAVANERKSGETAWSARVNKRGEKETPLAVFLRMNAHRGGSFGFEDAMPASPGGGVGGSWDPTSSNAAFSPRSPVVGGGGGGGGDRDREPPYHLVRRVVARRLARDDDEEDELLWPLAARGGGGGGGGGGDDDDVAATTRGMRAMRVDDPPRDPLNLIPTTCWEIVASFMDPRSISRLAAASRALRDVARSPQVRQAAHAAIFGSVAPPPAPPTQRPGAPPVETSKVAMEELGGKRAWAAACASALKAERWIPEKEASVDDDDDDGDDGEGDDDDGDGDDDDDGDDGDGDLGFDEGDGDFVVRDASKSTRTRNLTPTSTPRPRPKHAGVGPNAASLLLADGAAAISGDSEKIKLWFHGGDGATEPGKRIATLPNPAGTPTTGADYCSLASAHGVFVAGDRHGRVTVWDADSLDVRHPRVPFLDPNVVELHEGDDVVDVNALAFVSPSIVAVGCWNHNVVRLMRVGPADDENADETDVFIDLADNELRAETTLSWTAQAMAVQGVPSSHGNDFGRAANRGGHHSGAGAPTLWVCAHPDLLAVDVETRTVTEVIHMSHYDPYVALGMTPAACARGHVVVVASAHCAGVYDTRTASSSRNVPVAMCRHWDLGNDGDAGTDAVRVDGFKIGESMCCVDDWSVWLGARGGDAVALFDTRRASGPPRSLTRDRWHAGTVDDPPVALYGVGDGGVGGGGGGGAARGFGLGCFARGGDDAFIVAPLTDDCGSRCSVYTSAHHGLDSGAGDDGFDDDLFGSRKAKKKTKAKAKSRKYPKKQGGKFRARTAGG
jgi:hypothetical protein